MLGVDHAAPPLPRARGVSPHGALHASVLQALLAPPCFVAFSGGRDSSALLALATDVARREGLVLPVPITLRYPGAPETDETDWQERVVAHVRPEDWVRLELGDELDYLGATAQTVLRRHGVLWPMNAHVHLAYFPFTQGGSLIDGVDGDGVFSWGHAHAMNVLLGRTPPTRGSWRRVAALLAPPPVRRAHVRRASVAQSWLTAAAQEEFLRLVAHEVAAEPVSYEQRLHWYARSRYVGALEWTTRLLAEESNTRLVRPLLDPSFLSALAVACGRTGFRGRTAVMTWLFGEHLPADVLHRRTKASFPNFWGAGTSRFAEQWSGDGLDTELVDLPELRRTWAEKRDHRSIPLLQSAWLATVRERS